MESELHTGSCHPLFAKSPKSQETALHVHPHDNFWGHGRSIHILDHADALHIVVHVIIHRLITEAAEVT